MSKLAIINKENFHFYYSFDCLNFRGAWNFIFIHLQLNFNPIMKINHLFNFHNFFNFTIIQVPNSYFLKFKIMIMIQLFFLGPRVI